MFRVSWLILFIVQVQASDAWKQGTLEESSKEEMSSMTTCDVGNQPAPREGNLGQTGAFPWLGVIRVHLHNKNSFNVAMTGIVLVKKEYAVGNADDISRIPKKLLKEHTSAMFLAQANQPWFCRVKEYMAHPEYEYATMNTIALVELDSHGESIPIQPICWPSYSYNASTDLFAVGFHDENKLLEKTVFSLQYVGQELCDEFYNRAGFREEKIKTAPIHLLCGFAQRNKDSCTWDNGMVMASNSTGTWMLLGLGVRGPGCAAPARFIEMLPYLQWIESATTLNGEIYDMARRSVMKGLEGSETNQTYITLSPDKLILRKTNYTEDNTNKLTSLFVKKHEAKTNIDEKENVDVFERKVTKNLVKPTVIVDLKSDEIVDTEHILTGISWRDAISEEGKVSKNPIKPTVIIDVKKTIVGEEDDYVRNITKHKEDNEKLNKSHEVINIANVGSTRSEKERFHTNQNTPAEMHEVTEYIIRDNEKKPYIDNVDSIDIGPKESALTKVLVSAANGSKIIMRQCSWLLFFAWSYYLSVCCIL